MTISVTQTGVEPDTFLAVAGEFVVSGQSVGAVLDAAFTALGNVSAARVIIQKMGGDQFFSAVQLERLQVLTDRQRAQRDAGAGLTPEDDTELDALIRAEFAAMKERAKLALEETK